MPPIKQKTTLVGVWDTARWTNEAGDYIIGILDNGVVVKGKIPSAEEGFFVPHITYQFQGHWHEHEAHGKQFIFDTAIIREPHDRRSVVAYLTKYAKIAPSTANQLWDKYGEKACDVLRTDPAGCSASLPRYLPLDRAEKAADAMRALLHMQDARLGLLTLFEGRGFSGQAIEECIRRWGIHAPTRIRRDPFCMLVDDIPSAGFDRCNRLYCDLGLHLGRLKRQLICLWYVIREGGDGDVWLPASDVVKILGTKVSLEEPKAANGRKRKKEKSRTQQIIDLGKRAGWIADYQDKNGKWWIADGDKARAEEHIAAKLKELGSWEFTRRQFAEAGR